MNALMNPCNAPLTMTSREIAELTGKNHADVMRDIRNMVEQLTKAEMLSYAKSTTYTGKDGRQYPQYELDKDTSLNLLLGYDPVARMKVVKRWQELEAGSAPAINMRDPRQIAMAALQLIEVNQELQATIEQQQRKIAEVEPKAQALDLIAADDKALTVTQAAKVLGIKREALTNWLHANGWMYRQNGSWVAYQQHIQNGRLQFKEARYTDANTGQECMRPYCHILPKGLAILAKHFAVN